MGADLVVRRRLVPALEALLVSSHPSHSIPSGRETRLVEDRTALICRSKLHLFIAQTDMTALDAFLICLLVSRPATFTPRHPTEQLMKSCGGLTIGSLCLAASPPDKVFCTNARLLFKGDGNAFGLEYVLVGRFSYATSQAHSHVPPLFLPLLD